MACSEKLNIPRTTNHAPWTIGLPPFWLKLQRKRGPTQIRSLASPDQIRSYADRIRTHRD